MSSISISTAVVIPARPATRSRLRLTARGRAVLLTVASLPLALGIAFAAIGSGSSLASGDAVAAVSFETVTVVPGDTLWSIASAIAPTADPRDVIGEISRLNMLRGGALQIGQELAIPAQYTD